LALTFEPEMLKGPSNSPKTRIGA